MEMRDAKRICSEKAACAKHTVEIIILPTELLVTVLYWLDTRSIMCATAVSTTWREVCRCDHLWSSVTDGCGWHTSQRNKKPFSPSVLVDICRRFPGIRRLHAPLLAEPSSSTSYLPLFELLPNLVSATLPRHEELLHSLTLPSLRHICLDDGAEPGLSTMGQFVARHPLLETFEM